MRVSCVMREKCGGGGRGGGGNEKKREKVVVGMGIVEGEGRQMCTYGGDGARQQRRDIIRSRSCARTRNGAPGSLCGEKTAMVIRAAPVMTALSARNDGNAYTRQALISARVVPAATNGDDGRPKLTKESEPQEYWKSKAEREGKTPWQDPLVISLLVSFVLIFVILGVAIGTGYVG